nr:hypothetical protein [uncultured Cohaesibacter sp.]
MTVPDFSSAALDAVQPRDLSTRSLRQDGASGVAFPRPAQGFGMRQSETVGLLSGPFSLETIPVIGDFFSVISSLFSSFDSSATGSAPDHGNQVMSQASPAKTDGAALPLASGSSNAPLDLSAYIRALDEMATGVVDLTGRESDQMAAVEGNNETVLPQITGLAQHPANKIPLDALAQMQARYIAMTSKED